VPATAPAAAGALVRTASSAGLRARYVLIGGWPAGEASVSRVRRSLLALGVVALGAFLLTGAGMLRWYAAPQAALVPLDPDVTVTLTGTGAAYDLAVGGTRTGPLTERVVIRGGGGAAGIAVWTVDRRLTGPGGVPLRLADERVTLDRRTAVAVACCGERPVHGGLTYLFPVGLARADQQVFDPATGRTAPARYAGEEIVAGQRTYRFTQSVPATDLRADALPGAPALPADPTGTPGTLARSGPPGARSAADTTGRVLAASQRTLWVEPASGVVVRVEERRQERLVPLAGKPVTLLDVRLRTDAGSVQRLAALAHDRRTRLVALRSSAPLALAVGGLALLLLGLGYRIVTMRAQSAAQGSTFGVDR
jgi:Porin PorA